MQKLKKSLAIGIIALFLVTTIPYVNTCPQKDIIKPSELSEENYGPPWVAITKPKSGYIYFFGREIGYLSPDRNKAIIIGPTWVMIERVWSSNDQPPQLEKIEIYIDGILKKKINVTYDDLPLIWIWDMSFGNHIIKDRAYFEDGTTTESEVSIWIFNRIFNSQWRLALDIKVPGVCTNSIPVKVILKNNGFLPIPVGEMDLLQLCDYGRTLDFEIITPDNHTIYFMGGHWRKSDFRVWLLPFGRIYYFCDLTKRCFGEKEEECYSFLEHLGTYTIKAIYNSDGLAFTPILDRLVVTWKGHLESETKTFEII